MSRIKAIGSFVCVLAWASAVCAQSGATGPYIGEVKGDSVNVRCGPDTNYPIMVKLNTGDRVTVIQKTPGWLQIEPPKGTYCLVAKDYVIKDRDGSGVISGNNVNVRAGSELTTSRPPLTQLAKGATVKILGEHPDGFYKIAPPDGAYLWMSEHYVKRVPNAPEPVAKPVKTDAQPAPKAPAEAKPAAATPMVVAKAPAEKAPDDKAPVVAPVVAKPAVPTTQPAPAEPAKYQAMLDALETELGAEISDKPMEQWDLDPFVARYQAIADQDTERVAKLFAVERLNLLKDRIEVQQTLVRLRAERAKLQEQQRIDIQKRTAMRASTTVLTKPFDVEGEIRKSWAFTDRYRLVDRASDQTIAYLISSPTGPDVKSYLGRYVGIHAARKDLEKQVFVIVPAEITVIGQPSLSTPTTRPAR